MHIRLICDTTIIHLEVTEAAGMKRELGNDTSETVQSDGSNVKYYNMSVCIDGGCKNYPWYVEVLGTKVCPKLHYIYVL